MHYIGNDTFELSGGRRFNANKSLIGIGPETIGEGNYPPGVCEGYDGTLFYESEEEYPQAWRWTSQEKVELADYMIELWKLFRERHITSVSEPQKQ